MSTQLSPDSPQRCHWREYASRSPVQLPRVVRSTWPSIAWPVILGATTFFGGFASTGAVSSDVAETALGPLLAWYAVDAAVEVDVLFHGEVVV